MAQNTVNHVGRRVLSGLTAIGTSQGTGFPLANDADHQFTTVGSGTGATLPSARLPSRVAIWNGGASTLTIYPPSGGKINDGSVNASTTLGAGSGVSFFASDLGTWYTASSSGVGTVTTVSIVSANGFAGSVATATSTPAVTLSTSITGVLKGNGTAISAAVANTDYVTPSVVTLSSLVIGSSQVTGLATSATTDTTVATNITSGTLPAAQLPVFVASGGSHAKGAVPDPGASAGTTHYLREDATWAIPPTSAVTTGLLYAFANKNLVM
jgi:hypothetical protein